MEDRVLIKYRFICRFTQSADETKIYAMMTSWPGETVRLGVVDGQLGTTIQMLGTSETLTWAATAPGITVNIPRPDNNMSKWVWTLVITKP
jgi:hypothetical protein